MILADKIMTLRKKNGWSQEELAEKLNTTRQSVSKWESAQSTPELDKILMLGQIFGVSTDYLLKDEITVTECTSGKESAARRVSPADADAFLALAKKNARRITLGAALCILSPVCLLMLSAMADTQRIAITENAAAGIGLIVLLLTVAVAASLFISGSYLTRPFAFLETEVFETEYGVADKVRHLQAKHSARLGIRLAAGCCLCVLSVAPLFITIIFTEDAFLLTAAVALLFVLAAAGAALLVYNGCVSDSYNKLLQLDDYTPQKKLKKASK